jgi:hypothetical protein
VTAALREAEGRQSAMRTELALLHTSHKLALKALEETSARFLQHVNVTLSQTHEDAQQIAGMIDEIQSSRFWAIKRAVARLFGRDRHR